MSDPSDKGVKSAYERALERLEADGIEKPRQDKLTAAVRQEIQQLRDRANARLAELEILHRDGKASTNAEDRDKSEREYVAERGRIESKLEREIERLRQ